MDFEDFTATIRSRLSGPIFFPYILSFVVVNWKAVFLLFFSERNAQARIVQFEANVTFLSLFIIPPIIATVLILGVPQLKWLFALANASPVEKKRLRDARTDHIIEKNRLLFQAENARLRVEIAEKNKLADTIVETIDNSELKKQTEESFVKEQPNADFPNKTGLEKFVDGSDWLHVRSVSTLEIAKLESREQNKPLLLITYDPEARNGGDLIHATNAFFRYMETQKLFSENFILHLSPIINVEEFLQNMEISTERPIYVLFSANFKIFDRGRLNANADTGLNKAKKWVTMKLEI